jgi:hypothetical protein
MTQTEAPGWWRNTANVFLPPDNHFTKPKGMTFAERRRYRLTGEWERTIWCELVDGTGGVTAYATRVIDRRTREVRATLRGKRLRRSYGR